MSDIAIPNGLAAVGYDAADVPDLVTARSSSSACSRPPRARSTEEDAPRASSSRSLELW